MMSENWQAAEADLPAVDHLLASEAQLALRDEVIGLRAELAQHSGESTLTPGQQLAVEQRLLEVQRSLAWRVGRKLTAPIRALQRIARHR